MLRAGSGTKQLFWRRCEFCEVGDGFGYAGVFVNRVGVFVGRNAGLVGTFRRRYTLSPPLSLVGRMGWDVGVGACGFMGSVMSLRAFVLLLDIGIPLFFLGKIYRELGKGGFYSKTFFGGREGKGALGIIEILNLNLTFRLGGWFERVVKCCKDVDSEG